MEAYQRLETELAAWAGYAPEQMVVCSSGTAALHLALESLRLPPGSEVIVPDFTMVACPRAVRLAGLELVFVDCRADNLLMDHELMPDAELRPGKFTVNTRAVMAVHVYGRQCDMDWVATYADLRGYPVIEDLAEAHGIKPHHMTTAACWSFYRNKIIAGEEGGAVAFRNPEHAALARQLRSLGFTEEHDFRHVPRGHNYRMANCLAERALSSLRAFDEQMVWPNGERGTSIEVRRRYEKLYDAECPVEWSMPPRQAPWVYDLRVPGLGRTKQGEIVRELNGKGIEARMGFWPMSCQTEFEESRRVERDGEEYRAEVAGNEVFYVPLTPGRVTPESVRSAFEVIRRHVGC